MFADDTQFWTDVNLDDPLDVSRKVETMQETFSRVHVWMRRNKLKLNTDKTEFLLITPKSRRKEIPKVELNLCGTCVEPSQHARNLGVYFDSNMSSTHNISSVIKSCYVSLRNISSIRSYLTQEATEILIHAFITSRLDFCNSLFVGLPKIALSRLQKIHNCAAKVISRKSKYDHVTPILKQLHWLPVEARIQFKILMFVHKCIYKVAPNYLFAVIQQREFIRNTRLSRYITLIEPRTKGKTYSNRAFGVAGPNLWNSLPFSIREIQDFNVYKATLKTYLFSKFF